MRLWSAAVAVALALCTLPVSAAETADNDLDDLVVVTAQPRSPEVKMVVQTLPERKAGAQPADKSADTANAQPVLVKTAAK